MVLGPFRFVLLILPPSTFDLFSPVAFVYLGYRLHQLLCAKLLAVLQDLALGGLCFFPR
ncbi:unnamed protein product [Natator depressus]